MARFSTALSEQDIGNLISSKIPSGTREKETWAIKLLQSCQKNRNSAGILPHGQLHVFENLDDLTACNLDYLLQFFLLETRTNSGDRFKSSTSKNLVAMIQYHFNKHAHEYRMVIF